jgi:hypothetical protein
MNTDSQRCEKLSGAAELLQHNELSVFCDSKYGHEINAIMPRRFGESFIRDSYTTLANHAALASPAQPIDFM